MAKMSLLVLFFVLVVVCCCGCEGTQARRLRGAVSDEHKQKIADNGYETHWFNVTLDHFRFTLNKQGEIPSFPLRVMINQKNWNGKGQLSNGCRGPILFYTGNEGPIEAFVEASGFLTDSLGPKWNALVVFAEHRYYGESLPFGEASLNPSKNEYLSIEQALADYASVITDIKATFGGAANCPVIAFGGSYGGTLTAYFRSKYPQVVAGGLAASAPIGYYAVDQWAEYGLDEYTWIDVVNRVYEEAGCLSMIEYSVSLIQKNMASDSGRNVLQSIFQLCEPPTAGSDDFLFWYTDALETIPQENYPYEIGSMPAWPVNASCALNWNSQSEAVMLANAATIASWYYGAPPPSSKCYKNATGQGGIPGGGPGPAAWGAWGYQSCAENLHKFSGRGVRNYTFSISEVYEQCASFFNTRPNLQWSERAFGGYELNSGGMQLTNVIFSNGGLDPWGAGGFLKDSPEPSVYTFWIPLGAHHLDLRAPNMLDPLCVTKVRDQEIKIMEKWIDEYVQNNP